MIKVAAQVGDLAPVAQQRSHTNVEIALGKSLHGEPEFLERRGQIESQKIAADSGNQNTHGNSGHGDIEWRPDGARSKVGDKDIAAPAGRIYWLSPGNAAGDKPVIAILRWLRLYVVQNALDFFVARRVERMALSIKQVNQGT